MPSRMRRNLVGRRARAGPAGRDHAPRKRSACRVARTSAAMPEFAYVAVDPRGREHAARSRRRTTPARAREPRSAQAVHVVKLAAARRSRTGHRAQTSTGCRCPRAPSACRAKQLTLFTRQLATISQVSPLEESLRTISRQSEQDHVRAIVARVADGVVEGRRLADAHVARAAAASRRSTARWSSAGESSGSLPELLERLAESARAAGARCAARCSRRWPTRSC